MKTLMKNENTGNSGDNIRFMSNYLKLINQVSSLGKDNTTLNSLRSSSSLVTNTNSDLSLLLNNSKFLAVKLDLFVKGGNFKNEKNKDNDFIGRGIGRNIDSINGINSYLNTNSTTSSGLSPLMKMNNIKLDKRENLFTSSNREFSSKLNGSNINSNLKTQINQIYQQNIKSTNDYDKK